MSDLLNVHGKEIGDPRCDEAIKAAGYESGVNVRLEHPLNGGDALEWHVYDGQVIIAELESDEELIDYMVGAKEWRNA